MLQPRAWKMMAPPVELIQSAPAPLMNTRRKRMSRSAWFFALSLAACLGYAALAQPGSAPRNDLPQPYRTTRDWGNLPPSMTKWPAVTAVEPAPDGTVYVVARCVDNSCSGRSEPPILKYDGSGKLIKAFGE